MLNYDTYKFVVQNTNLIAIDLIIKNRDDEILLGKRKNAPAKGYWFVPGGRIFKNEKQADAFKRILRLETGLDMAQVKNITFKGIYDHFYEDNYFEDTAFNTHYIVLACCMDLISNALIKHDSQHDDLTFMKIKQIISEKHVHQYTKNYFIKNNIPMLINY